MAKGQDRPRVGGSAFTVFFWDGKVIGFCKEARVTGVTPVAPAMPIQPLNAVRPVEIITAAAATYGTITLVLTDLYNQKVWDRLSHVTGSRDIVDIFRIIAARNNPINIVKHVNPPSGIGRGPYTETYHNCVIASVADNETITIDTMEITKEIEVWYTQITRDSGFTVTPISDSQLAAGFSG